MKVQVRSTSNVKIRGRVYRPGATIDLPEKEARKLIDLGAALEAGTPEARADRSRGKSPVRQQPWRVEHMMLRAQLEAAGG